MKVGSKPFTKSQFITALSSGTGLGKKEISAVMEVMAKIISQHLDSKKGPKTFTLPGLMKIKVVRKPATKARKGINPFTGAEMMFKAKPASNKVKILPLKGLKEMAK